MKDKTLPTVEQVLDKHVFNTFDSYDRQSFINAIEDFAQQRLKAMGEEIKEKALLEFKGDEIIGIDCNSIQTVIDNHLKNLK